MIAEKAAKGLTAQRIYQDLKLEIQFSGSYESVKRFVRQLRQADPARVWRIEVRAAEEGRSYQVQYATNLAATTWTTLATNNAQSTGLAAHRHKHPIRPKQVLPRSFTALNFHDS